MTSCFSVVRVYRSEDVPPPEPSVVDVAVLDMNHSWPNLGHDCIVQNLRSIAADLEPVLRSTGLSLRALSYDVRRSLMIPERPGKRFSLYIGSGGPGHIDPVMNKGVTPESQGVDENPAWQAPLFDLFSAIHQDSTAAMLGVCHTFGLLCLWSGVAKPVLRGPEKGGKSTGVVSSDLTPAATRHAWFSRLSKQLANGRRLQILDSRLFDLIPSSDSLPSGMTAIGFEVLPGGKAGDALTMLEIATDSQSPVPRVFAVNHHPEIVDGRSLRSLLDQKLASGEVTQDWYDERVRATESGSDQGTERALTLTSHYTFLQPIRFHLYRQVRRRAEELGRRANLHEDIVLAS